MGETAGSGDRLLVQNPQAYSDFFPSDLPCVYKSGPAWPKSKDSFWPDLRKEVRPIYDSKLDELWTGVGPVIMDYMTSVELDWTTINLFAYAVAGEAVPFCPRLVYIGVEPLSLNFEDAIQFAQAITIILAGHDIPDAEIAFIEAQVYLAAGPVPLMPFGEVADRTTHLRKPYTGALGVALALADHPHLEGTGSIYISPSRDCGKVALLTCAHVARRETEHGGKVQGILSGPHRDIYCSPGYLGYDRSMRSMTEAITTAEHMIHHCDAVISILTPSEGNQRLRTFESDKRRVAVEEFEKDILRRTIKDIQALQLELTKHWSSIDQRIIGSLLYYEDIVEAQPPTNYSSDWALIEIDQRRLDFSTFTGNKMYIGGKDASNGSERNFRTFFIPYSLERWLSANTCLLAAR